MLVHQVSILHKVTAIFLLNSNPGSEDPKSKPQRAPPDSAVLSLLAAPHANWYHFPLSFLFYQLIFFPLLRLEKHFGQALPIR